MDERELYKNLYHLYCNDQYSNRTKFVDFVSCKDCEGDIIKYNDEDRFVISKHVALAIWAAFDTATEMIYKFNNPE